MEENDNSNYGCLCKYITPCQPMCSCANPIYSAGCWRCCSGGSLDQRILKAKKLANIIDAARFLSTEAGESDTVRDCNNCNCAACNPNGWWMTTCEKCGNKRCPHAKHHKYKCTNSNQPDQECVEE